MAASFGVFHTIPPKSLAIGDLAADQALLPTYTLVGKSRNLTFLWIFSPILRPRQFRYTAGTTLNLPRQKELAMRNVLLLVAFFGAVQACPAQETSRGPTPIPRDPLMASVGTRSAKIDN
jgi:hypothetical protein